MRNSVWPMRNGVSTGISACAPNTYYTQSALSAINEDKGVVALTGIWTLDDSGAMGKYIDRGVDLVMTNQPKKIAKLYGYQS